MTTTSPMLQPTGVLRGGGASRGDARWYDGGAIAMSKGGDRAMDAGWRRNRDEQRWRRWATVGVAIGDGDCGGTIVMGHNGGGAMRMRESCNFCYFLLLYK